jgi:ribosomal protein S18 acetylase RimI-like enzyme
VLTIRPARLEDEEALCAIDRVAWTAAVSPAPESASLGPLADAAVRLDDVLVAEQEGTVLGYLRLDQSGSLPSHEHVLTINGLAVAPDRQGEGVGRRLVEAGLQEARRRGARKVSLRVLASNTRGRRLYESCGFAVEGVLVDEFHLDGRFVDDLLLAHHLRDA